MTDRSAINRFVEVTRNGGNAKLVLEGDWTIEFAAPIERELEKIGPELGAQHTTVIDGEITKLDTSGGFLLKRFFPGDAQFSGLTPVQKSLLKFLPEFSEYSAQKPAQSPAGRSIFENIGKKAFHAVDFLWNIFVFIGRVSISFFRSIAHPRRLRFPSIVRHIDETGILALPIIGLLAILISMVISYQGAVQLRKFGADIYTIDLTVVSLLREMGVLVTAIMVAGRSGSAFAAELGVMKVREEVNALKTMGLDPIELLVVPRVIALVISLPLLTFLADIIGLVGGGLMSLSLLDISFAQYLARVEDVATPTMFFIGMIKAPVFAFVIAVVSCYDGLSVEGSAEDIGRVTTLSVVQSIFIVIMADALFSVVFSKVGI